MTKNKQILFSILTITGDLVISFVITFLLALGFSTTPSVRCAIGDDKTLAEVEKACREYIPYFHSMFMIEILIGFIIIAISNYFIYKALFKKAILATIITLIIYIIVIGLIYNSLYQDFIAVNLERLEC